MQYTRMGRTGLKMSRIVLGMMSYGDPGWRDWVLDEAASEPFVVAALEAGITTFDTSNMYSDGASEQVTGTLLGRHAEREDVVIATKVFFNFRDGRPNRGGLSRKHVLSEVDASLRRLDTDYIDLYQIHRLDPETPIEETMLALHECVVAGKVRYLGASSMWTWQFVQANEIAARNGWTPFTCMQNHHNLLYREEEREMLPYCRDAGIGVIPWSPLARGLIARAHAPDTATKRNDSDTLTPHLYAGGDREILSRVAEVADRLGAVPAQVGLAWLLHQPGITGPIIGATKLSHLTDAVGALDLELTPEDLAALEEPYTARPVVGHS